MSPRRGGEGAKFGERYEGRWTVARLLDVLQGTAVSLLVEDEEALAEGAEFTLRRPGFIEVHQVKLAPANAPSWTLRALKREGVLAAAALHAQAGHEFHFISRIPAPWFDRLADAARRSADAASLARVHVQTTDARNQLDFLEDEWGNAAAAWRVLCRVRVQWPDERQLLAMNAALAEVYLKGGSGTLMSSGLGDLIADNLGLALDAPTVDGLLDTYGLGRSPLSPATLGEAVADTRKRWQRTVVPRQLAAIAREETETIATLLRDEPGAVVVVVGVAGGGKSVVLAQVVEALQDWSVLAMRIDRRQPFETPDQLGKQLDLPISPVAALGLLAGDRPSLLLVDQLDAVSLASGRLAEQLEPILEMVREARAFPSMRVLLACRQYDLDHDARLRELVSDEGIAQLETVGPLSAEQIDTAVQGLDLDLAGLTSDQRRLLSLPLNLVLLAEIADQEDALAFASTTDLLRSYYERKGRDADARAAPRAVRFGTVVTVLAGAMSDRQQLSVPRAVVDTGDLAQDVEVLTSEGVLVRDGDRVAFFHESLFDFAFARAWVAGEDDLRVWLLSGEQELFRRAQVRQILQHLHDAEPERFRRDVRRCITDPAVRFHIKDAVLGVLAALRDPSAADWSMVLALQGAEPRLAGRLRTALWSTAWFARADAEGTLEPWLDSGEDTAMSMALEIMRGGVIDHGDRAAELVARLAGHAEYPNAVVFLVRAAQDRASRALLDLALDLVRAGRFPGGEREVFLWFLRLHERQPEWACELLGAWLVERPGALAVDRGHVASLESRDYGLLQVIAGAARRAPHTFVTRLLPFVLDVVRTTAVNTDRRPQTDHHFMFRSVDDEDRSVGDALLFHLAESLRWVGGNEPDAVRKLITPLLATDYDAAQWLAYQGLIGAGATHAGWAADVLLERPSRLESGYMDNQYWTTRELLAATGNALDNDRAARLEAVILALTDEHPYSVFTLLTGLPEVQLSESGRMRLGELRKELAMEQPEPPQPTVFDARIGSPVPPEKVAQFDDEDWLAAMAQHSDEPSVGVGGARELSRVLEEETKNDPNRFAKLGLRLDETFNAAYLSAILRGIVEPAEPADQSRIFALIRHAASLDAPDVERWIAWPLNSLAQGEVPEDVINIVLDLARGARSPEQPGLPAPGTDMLGRPIERMPDLLASGMNTARGQAVCVLARLLAADEEGHRTALIAPALRDLAADHSLSVRACVARLLLAALRHDRAKGVAAAAVLLDASDVLLTAPPVQQLCYWLEDDAVVRRMLSAELPDVREAGGALAAYDALERERPALLEVALAGDTSARRGAVRLCARRIAVAGDRQLAMATVREAFDAGEETIRKAAAEVAPALRGLRLEPYTELLLALVASPTFTPALSQLSLTLEYAPDRIDRLLPPTVERFLELFGDESRSLATGAAASARQLGTLVLRLYAQTEEPTERARALDLLDLMLEAQSFGIDDLVNAAER